MNALGVIEMHHVQINIAIPSQWKVELENLARGYSVGEETTLTYIPGRKDLKSG
jgi:hypothetical protein